MKPQEKNLTTEGTEKRNFRYKNSVFSVVNFDNTVFFRRRINDSRTKI